MTLGMAEVEKNPEPANCRRSWCYRRRNVGRTDVPAAAQQAAQKKIKFTIMGVGTEWNSSLIKDLAKLAKAPGITSTSTPPRRRNGVRRGVRSTGGGRFP